MRGNKGRSQAPNMTGKKNAKKYEQIPYFWTEMFDLHMDFIGDFSVQPTRIVLRGTYAKKKFGGALLPGRSAPGHPCSAIRLKREVDFCQRRNLAKRARKVTLCRAVIANPRR